MTRDVVIGFLDINRYVVGLLSSFTPIPGGHTHAALPWFEGVYGCDEESDRIGQILGHGSLGP